MSQDPDDLALSYARIYETIDGRKVLGHLIEVLGTPRYRMGGQAHDAVADVRSHDIAKSIASMITNGKDRKPVSARPYPFQDTRSTRR